MEQLDEVVSIRGVGIPDLMATIVLREDDICLYKRSDGVYEVFKVKVSPAAEVFGKPYPEREVYPGNEDFGNTAWCTMDYERAKARYDLMLRNKTLHAEVDA